MKPDRTTAVAPRDQLLKVASDQLVREFGGQDAAGEHIGCRQQRISDCVRPNTPDFLRVNEVAALEDATHGRIGHPVVTRALARRQGFMLVRQPSAPPSDTDILKLLGDLAAENGDIAKAVLSAIADGRIDAAERAHIIEQIMEQQTVGAAMIAMLQAAGNGPL
ncbi:MAG: phage regulatory CII family protein [Pseudomonadota bacterium]